MENKGKGTPKQQEKITRGTNSEESSRPQKAIRASETLSFPSQSLNTTTTPKSISPKEPDALGCPHETKQKTMQKPRSRTVREGNKSHSDVEFHGEKTGRASFPKKKQRKNQKWAESEPRKEPREVRASALAAHGLSVSLASCRPSSPPRKKAWRVPHENQASHCRSSGKKGEEKETLCVYPKCPPQQKLKVSESSARNGRHRVGSAGINISRGPKWRNNIVLLTS